MGPIAQQAQVGQADGLPAGLGYGQAQPLQSSAADAASGVNCIQATLPDRLFQLPFQVGHHSGISIPLQIGLQASRQPGPLLSVPAAGDRNIIAGGGVGLLQLPGHQSQG